MNRGNRARQLASNASEYLAEGIFTPYAEMALNPADDPSLYEMEDEVDSEDGEEEEEGAPVAEKNGACMSAMSSCMSAIKKGDKAKAMSSIKGAMSAYKKEHGGKNMCGSKHMSDKKSS